MIHSTVKCVLLTTDMSTDQIVEFSSPLVFLYYFGGGGGEPSSFTSVNSFLQHVSI